MRVGLTAKGRNGKQVTVISGVPLEQAGMMELSRELKKKCGTGGTVKDDQIEIQGDHRALLIDELKKRNWRVKSWGG